METKKIGIIKIDDLKYKMLAFLLARIMIQQVVLLSAQIFHIYSVKWYSIFCYMVLGIILLYIGFVLIGFPTRKDVFMICSIWILLFGASVIKYRDELQGYISELGSLVLLSFLSIVIGLNKIEDIGKLEKELRPYVFIMGFFSLLNVYLNMRGGGYSMSFSYEAILFALFSLIFAVVYGKKYYYFFFLLYCVSNLRAGSRGSFLCIFIAFMLIIIIYGQRTNVKIGVLLGGSLGCVVLIFGNQIIDFLSMLIGHSRTLVLLKSGEIFSMSGRENFYNLMRKALFENLFLIKGFYADRVYLCNSFGKPFSPGTYAHNIIYEIVYDFGGVGIIFLLFLLYYTFKCYKIVKMSGDNAVKNLYIVSVSYAFGQLFISSSFLIAPSFGILIATYLFICHYKRVKFK